MSYLLADMDRPIEMVELTVVGLIPPQALGRNVEDGWSSLLQEPSLQTGWAWRVSKSQVNKAEKNLKTGKRE